ncbi:hypothetical protein M9Y10_007443 [Tritrichomonas musculus]|uniref:G domain-containing protein n=1 Tax=Tritrichomonas musculus TaxID=1915356 RepID=A0ABR2J2M9_9EUKA
MSLTICQTSDLTMLPPYNESDSVSIDEFFLNRWNDFQDITKIVASFISKKLEKIKQINMIISGTTGSGKSTLINNLFRGNYCRTGIGKPITYKIRQTKINNIPLTIYETPGFELDVHQQEQLKNDMYNLIEEKAQMNDINESIHCILYCVNCETGRFQSEEENFIRNFVDNPRIGNIPVILVLTQCYDNDKRDKMMVELDNMNLNVKQIVPVVAKARTFNIRGVKIDCHQYGLDILIEVIENCLPNIWC